MPDHQDIRVPSSGGAGKLIRAITDSDLGPQRDAVFVGVSDGGFEPAPAGTLLALVCILHFADAVAGAGQVLLDGDGDQFRATYFPCQFDRLC